MKKILISLSIILVVASFTIGVTSAYIFRPKFVIGPSCEIDCGGGLDLKIDIDGVIYNPLNRPIFQVKDMKPGDWGEETLSFHVNKNACGFVFIDLRQDRENGCNEPEKSVDYTCGNPGRRQGELNDEVRWVIWKDEGSVAGWQCGNTSHCSSDSQEGDNVLNGIETVLLSGTLNMDKIFGLGDLIASQVSYYGIQWCFGDWGQNWSCQGQALGNETQTDSFRANMIIKAEPKTLFPRGCPSGRFKPPGCQLPPPCGTTDVNCDDLINESSCLNF